MRRRVFAPQEIVDSKRTEDGFGRQASMLWAEDSDKMKKFSSRYDGIHEAL